ncbi:S-adenosyl-L-methionine-dependent methyltransferase [Zopfochytrium polystomum]|nr:S-adenosyl-L-methionine-dependent methyltransferase [Zopfochytrium polystomum]
MSLSLPMRPVGQLFPFRSEPAISHSKNLDDDEGPRLRYSELLLGAETLEGIVAEGIYKGITMRKVNHARKQAGREMTDRVLRLVYGTMKYLPFIDLILVKTQFLVYNNHLLNQLGLVKIMLFDLMKYHVDYQKYPGVDYTGATPSDGTREEIERADIVRELDDSLQKFGVKLAAAYARLRIERGAVGHSSREQMENMLSEEVRAKETQAVEIPKTVRVNVLKSSTGEVLSYLQNKGIPISLDDSRNDACIRVDDQFADFLVVPPELVERMRHDTLVDEGKILFQDKASAYAIKHAETILQRSDSVVFARSGCGTGVAHLACTMKNKGRIIAFEDRPARRESLMAKLRIQGLKNIDIIESDFLVSDPTDEKFKNVKLILVEPPSSGTAVVDKLGFLLQEEEYPSDSFTQKDIAVLRRQQLNLLKHALSFPSAQHVLYVSRAFGPEENEYVINDTSMSVGGQWGLSCVLPDIVLHKEHDWEHEECLTIKPSVEEGNGIFVACFSRISVKPELPIEDAPEAIEATQSRAENAQVAPRRRKGLKHAQEQETKGARGSKGKRDSAVVSNFRLSKAQSMSVARLSAPRRLVESLAESLPRLSKATQKTDILRRDSKHIAESGDLIDEQDDEKIAANDKSDDIDMDLGVFGTTLKSFYAPKTVALNHIRANPQIQRWSYPVSAKLMWSAHSFC